MQDFAQSFVLAGQLVVSGDPALAEIVALSIQVTLTALVISALIGLPLGALLAVARFPGSATLSVLANALMGLPPVVVGLLVYMMLSNAGPLGVLGLLYTPTAMIIAQAVLITPIIIALTRQVIADLNRSYAETFKSMVVPAHTAIAALIWDARFSLLTVLLAGFGRAIAEVGAVMIVGGNINHVTRVMTTAIALETSKGELALALALGFVLLLMALSVNAAVALLRQTDRSAVHV
ncbi:tungstate transport system permease protein [Roseibium hamelinense]|uniref:Tungstate transport system permease protein n=1 Tax=Roseibium hamelinense TaxID=150831 RepID=A0A562TGG1_9HYPH|nr:ABC transporter permease [Roseibium hamelinense]MTI46120.1 ABC transporter permease subunit [Roseibium hamelinense]TWI92687.1 tungstate transport system permease protein [Roseibium hamelinense]